MADGTLSADTDHDLLSPISSPDMSTHSSPSSPLSCFCPKPRMKVGQSKPAGVEPQSAPRPIITLSNAMTALGERANLNPRRTFRRWRLWSCFGANRFRVSEIMYNTDYAGEGRLPPSAEPTLFAASVFSTRLSVSLCVADEAESFLQNKRRKEEKGT